MARKISNNIKINESYTGDEGAKLKNKNPIHLSKAVKAVAVAVLGLSITFASERVVSNMLTNSHFNQWDIQAPDLDDNITTDDRIDLGDTTVDVNDNQQNNDNVSDKTEDKTDDKTEDKVNDKTDDNTNDNTEGTDKDNQDINLTPGPTTPGLATYSVALQNTWITFGGEKCRVAYIQSSDVDTAVKMIMNISIVKGNTLDKDFLVDLYLRAKNDFVAGVTIGYTNTSLNDILSSQAGRITEMNAD